MNQIENGLFAVEDTMPCSPRDIHVGRYALPSTLQRAEREEAAARILTFSQQLDSWVGVSWLRLVEVMREELKQHQQWNIDCENVHRHNCKEWYRFNAAVRKYRILCILTLGLYALFVGKPTKQLQELPTFDSLPFSTLFIFGPSYVVEGIHELVDGGMLKCVQEGEGDNAIDIFFPTPALITTIMRKQGLTVA